MLDLLEREGDELRERLFAHTRALPRASSSALGLDVVPGEHPIVPVMFGDAHRASAAAERLLEHGVYVVAFSYPVVPLGQARIRTQLSAALSDDDVDRAIAAFAAVACGLSCVTAGSGRDPWRSGTACSAVPAYSGRLTRIAVIEHAAREQREVDRERELDQRAR